MSDDQTKVTTASNRYAETFCTLEKSNVHVTKQAVLTRIQRRQRISRVETTG